MLAGRSLPIWLLFAVLALARSTLGLYFYLDPNVQKCFLEELPNDTVVVGHYMTEEWDTAMQRFVVKDDMAIHITVREVREDHIVTSSRGPPEGKFAFTSHEPGDHRICMQALFDGRAPQQIRMHLDIVIGDAKPDNSHRDKSHVNDLAQRVRDLNAQLRDIRREQQYQREREAEFRNLSESTNSRALWWSSLQLITLLGACVWQFRHLRVSPTTVHMPTHRSVKSKTDTLPHHRSFSKTRNCASPAAPVYQSTLHVLLFCPDICVCVCACVRAILPRPARTGLEVCPASVGLVPRHRLGCRSRLARCCRLNEGESTVPCCCWR